MSTRKPSPAQQAALTAQYNLGLHRGSERERENLKVQLAETKLKQIQAVTALVEAQTKALSRTGYLISQLNKDKGW